MRANGSTSPAASINYYYERRQPVKTFIIITDEEENTSTTGHSSWGYSDSNGKGLMFSEVYERYVKEVYPARLIFISFSNPNRDAQMVTELKTRLGESTVAEYIDVYKFDTRNPDLNRFDFVLHRLAN
jgi:hypothetical protein